MKLTEQQLSISEAPLDSTIFLSGPAGTGKTTAGTERLLRLIQSGVPGRSILLFFPQRNLGDRYQKALSVFSSRGLSLPVMATYGGLARRILSLFWPTILEQFPQLHPNLPPTFLTLESSLYFLSRIVEPLIENQGFFASVTIQRNRLYSQILDNLNKAAIHVFPHTEISERLISAWIGDPSQEIIYHQAQQAANQFRDHCYQNNLLDYSLQIELFTRSIAQIPLVRSYLLGQFDYLIYDNCEEDIPASHDFIKMLFPHLSSSLVIYDEDAGYRSFLGASPSSGLSLSEFCSNHESFHEILTSSSSLQILNKLLVSEITGQSSSVSVPAVSIASSVSINFQPSYPEMVSWVSAEVSNLVSSGVSPGQIVILAPYLSDSLRFLLQKSLDHYLIPTITHRPSRALRDEPVTQSLLTLASLAHPAWEIYPSVYEVALALVQAVQGLDLTRAYLLAQQAVKNKPSSFVRLADFGSIPENYQDRISFHVGNRYQELLDWMNAYASRTAFPLDYFLTHLFGEMLSRSGYGFYNDLTKGRITAQIIESASNFRLSAGKVLDLDPVQCGKEYFRMVKTGVLANQYIKSWTELPENQLLISPAYTFLLNNKPVDYQFWLDVGSRGWYERIYQPLTNPHVLHRDWLPGQLWRDAEEQQQNIDSLVCVATGLIRRSRKSIYGCLTETDEHGYEQKGLLLLSLNKVLANSKHSTGKEQ